jgi:hypothetical protein
MGQGTPNPIYQELSSPLPSLQLALTQLVSSQGSPGSAVHISPQPTLQNMTLVLEVGHATFP